VRSVDDEELETRIAALLRAPIDAEAARAYVRQRAGDVKRAVEALDDTKRTESRPVEFR
jgi:hypothetical protein